MAILPDSLLSQLEFFETRNPEWAAAPANLGLSASQMSSMIALTTAARASYTAMQVARAESTNATQAWYDNQEAMRVKGADLIKVIKAFAAATNNPGVYTAALLPPPKSPSPLPPPATPTSLTATLLNNGAIKIEWKASIEGTSFGVWRKLNLTGQAYEQVGIVTGVRTFTDATLPAGGLGSAGPGVFYQVQAHRGGLTSEFSEPVNIRFGSVDGESGGEELKIAA
jgi:hypothetical protein